MEARGAKFDEHSVALARTIMDSLAGDFDPSEVEDTYTPKLESAIRSVAKGKPYVPATPVAEARPVVDLLGALQASVAAAKAKGGTKRPTPKKPAAKQPAPRRQKQPA